MTPERRLELLAASRLGRSVLGGQAQFTYNPDQSREANGRFGSGGGGAGGEFKPSGDGKHGVALPKNPKKLNIAESHTALKEMGYKIGGERYDLKAKTSLIDLAHPDGTTSTVTGDQVKSIVYGGKRAAPARDGTPPAKPDSVDDLRRRLKDAEAKVATARAKVAAVKGKTPAPAAPPAKPVKPAKPPKPAKPVPVPRAVKATPAATPKAAPKAAPKTQPAKPPKAEKPAKPAKAVKIDHAAVAARVGAAVRSALDQIQGGVKKGAGRYGEDRPGDYDREAADKVFGEALAGLKSKKDLVGVLAHMQFGDKPIDPKTERWLASKPRKELERQFKERTQGRIGSLLRVYC